MGIIIKEACREDINFIKKLETESGLSEWTTKDYLQEIADNNKLFLVARKDGEFSGFILARLIITKTIKFNISEIEIYNIAVKKELRRKKLPPNF